MDESQAEQAELRAAADRVLIKAISERQDGAALGALMDVYAPDAARYALRILGGYATREAVQDVVSDTFVNVWRYVGHYDMSKGSVKTWIVAICKNAALQKRRTIFREEQRAVRVSTDDLQLHGASLVDTREYPYEEDFDRNWIREHFARIPSEALISLWEEAPRDAELIVRRYVKNELPSEIAGDLGLSPGTVRVRLHRSVAKLRMLMEREGKYDVGRRGIGAGTAGQGEAPRHPGGR